MDAYSFLTELADDCHRHRLRKERDLRKWELDQAWAECERIGREIDERNAAWKTAYARWRELHATLQEAELAVLAGPAQPEKH
jgi:hypothetical protein